MAAAQAPTLGQVMRRPRWIAAFFGVMCVAAAFAGLAQWQMSNAIRPETSRVDTETVQPLASVSVPGESVKDRESGQMVSFTGSFVPADFAVVQERINGGKSGFWVIGHLQLIGEKTGEQAGKYTSEHHHLAVGIGWSESERAAQQAAAKLQTSQTQIRDFTGRYNPSESPTQPAANAPQNQLRTVAAAQLINRWEKDPQGGVYAGYAVLAANTPEITAAGLTPIDSPPPQPAETINWLNLFYAAEWVIFAGFAFYFWVRLCRDAREREIEAVEQKAGSNQTRPAELAEHTNPKSQDKRKVNSA